MDTRNGDVKRLAIQSLAVAKTPTANAVDEAGTYQIACRSTSSDTRSDFFCFRMNSQTGEIVLVPLQSVAVIPEGAKDPLSHGAQPAPAHQH